jgi:hypothetical protein
MQDIQDIVISTGAAHAFVSSAAEKSASLPQLLIRHALAVVPAMKASARL